MANAFTSPSNLPDRSAGIAGADLSADLRDKLGDSQNWAHAEGPCGNMLTQNWGPGVFIYNTVLAQDVCVWRLPHIPAHPTLNLTLQARTYGTIGIASSTVTFRTITAADSASIVFAGDEAFAFDDTTISFDGETDGYDDLHLDIAALNHTIEIRGVSAAFDALTSPLAAGPAEADGFVPWGATVAAADNAAPTSDGHRFISNGNILMDYPRGFMCWSAIRGIQGGPSSAPEEMQEYDHRSIILPTPGTIARGSTAQVWVRVIADEVEFTEVEIHAGPLSRAIPTNGFRWGVPAATIVVSPIGEAAEEDRITWVEAQISVAERRWQPSLPWSTAAIGIRPGEAYTGRETSARVIGVSVWGV